MKCIMCETDSNYKDRESGKCPKCGHTFAFEPKKGDPFTDMTMKGAIDAVSAKGTVRFADSHVYYQLCRQLKPSFDFVPILGSLAFFVACVVFGALGFGSLLLGFVAGVVFGGLTFAALVYVRVDRGPGLVRLTRSSFETAWASWQKVNGPPKGVVAFKQKQIAARPAALEAELRQYSFDRAVICDSRETVDVLVANRFHFENNCAILTEGGYPEASFHTVRAMLRNNPRLVVVVLHDATFGGCGMAERLRADPEWFAAGVKIVDVGLRPKQAGLFPGQALRMSSPRPRPLPNGVSAAEADWLVAYRLEVAAIRPEQLVKRLFAAFVEAEREESSSGGDGGSGGGGGGSDGGSGGALMGVGMSDALSTEASTSDGGGDSFG